MIPVSDPSYKLEFTPQNFTEYTFAKKKLDDFQLVNLNLVISKLSSAKQTTIRDSLGIEWEISFVAFIDFLYQSMGDVGPFLIISKNVRKWEELTKNFKGLTTLIYDGNQAHRQEIRKDKMFNQDQSLKFNILIATSELTDKDYSSINKINFHFAILHNYNSGKHMPKSCKSIHFITDFTLALPPEIGKLEDFATKRKDNYFLPIEESEEKELYNDFLNLLNQIPTVPHPKPLPHYFLDCPLSDVQKSVLKALFADFRDENGYFHLCHEILRICTHPYLLLGMESKLGPIDFIKSSTKMTVFQRLIQEDLKGAKKILVLSQFNGTLNIVEDFAAKYEITSVRLTSPNVEIENSDAQLMLYNPLYCSLNVVTEFIDYIVIIDGDHSVLLEQILKNPNRNLKAIYTLQCQVLCEPRLTDICMRVNSRDDANCESLCKIAAVEALRVTPVPPTEYIISNASYQEIDSCTIFDIEYGETQNFWQLFRESLTKPHFPLPPDDSEHVWTRRERDQLFRSLFAYGWNRWQEVIHYGGLRLSEAVVIDASRSILRHLLQSSKSSSFVMIRDFIREAATLSKSSLREDEKSDQKFMEQSVFAEPSFRMKIKAVSDDLLKRIEALAYLKLTVESFAENSNKIPISRTLGKSPTPTWTETHDRILLVGTYRYGFGSYDHFPEDPDPRYREVSLCAEQKVLDERLLRLAENLKRSQTSSDSMPMLIASDDDDDEIELNLSVHWSTEEKRKMSNYLLRMGVSKDFEEMREGAQLENKTADQVKEYVDDYMRRCDLKPEEGGLKNKTSIRTKKRVQMMNELRRVVDEEPNVFETAPRWRKFPDGWTSQVEKYFFTQMRQRGLGTIEEILSLDEFKNMIDVSTLPAFITKNDSIFKRIHTLYDHAINKRPPAPSSAFYNPSQGIGSLHPVVPIIPNPFASSETNQSNLTDKTISQNQTIISNQINAQKQSKQEKTEEQPGEKSERPVFRLVKKRSYETTSNEASTDNDGNNFPHKKERKSEESSASESAQNDSEDETSKSESGSDVENENDDSGSESEGEWQEKRRSFNQRKQIARKPVPVPKAENVKSRQRLPREQKIDSPVNVASEGEDTSMKLNDFVFPVPITATSSIINIGTIVTDRPLFHNQRYVYPAGYKSLRVFSSVDNPDERANWISEIIDTGEEAPLFRVSMEGTSHVFEGQTPTAPWALVLKEISRISKGRGHSISGPEAFLLAAPKTIYLIQQLPGIDQCIKYQKRVISSNVFQDNPKKSTSSKTETPNGNKKELNNSLLRQKQKHQIVNKHSAEESTETNDTNESTESNDTVEITMKNKKAKEKPSFKTNQPIRAEIQTSSYKATQKQSFLEEYKEEINEQNTKVDNKKMIKLKLEQNKETSNDTIQEINEYKKEQNQEIIEDENINEDENLNEDENINEDENVNDEEQIDTNDDYVATEQVESNNEQNEKDEEQNEKSKSSESSESEPSESTESSESNDSYRPVASPSKYRKGKSRGRGKNNVKTPPKRPQPKPRNIRNSPLNKQAKKHNEDDESGKDYMSETSSGNTDDNNDDTDEWNP